MLKKTKEIEQRIKSLKNDKKQNKVKNTSNTALDIAFELVAALIVGVIIGLFFDNLFDSKPLFLIISIMLSNIAAFRLIWNKYVKKDGS